MKIKSNLDFFPIKAIILLTAFIVTFNFFELKAYDIKVEINNCPDYYVFFGKHRGPDFVIIDSLPVKNNFVNFRSNQKLEHGVYFIVIPPQTRFDFIIDEIQNFTIKTDMRNVVGELKIDGDQDYSIFADLQRQIAGINKSRAQLEMQIEFFKLVQNDTIIFIQKQIDSLNFEQQSLYRNYRKKVKSESFFYKILNLLVGIDVPDSISSIAFTAPEKHFNYYKNHWLDRVDFNDEALLNTPTFAFHKLLEDYCFYFLDTKVNNIESTFPDIDELVAKTENNLAYNQYILSYLISRYENPKDLRFETLLVYIYRTYFLSNKPDWINEQAFSIMKFRIEAIQYNLLSSIAKNLILPDYQGKLHSIYDMPNKYKLLLFWEPDCDICTETALVLQSLYHQLQEFDLEIYAVLTNKENAEWQEFIEENSLDWINVYDPKGESNFEQYYGTYKSPRIFLLSQNNVIISKDIKVTSLIDFINYYESKTYEKQKNIFTF